MNTAAVVVLFDANHDHKRAIQSGTHATNVFYHINQLPKKVRNNMVHELRAILLALIAGALCWASVGLLLWVWLG
jgi:hypothetical protein